MRIVRSSPRISSVFFCTDTPTPEIYTLSLHDALPIYQDVRGDFLQHAAVGVDEADVAAAGDAEVGVARLPRAVHGAAHDGDLEGLRVGAQPLLDLDRELLDADVVAAARGARDHHRPSLAQSERLQDLPRHLDLLDRIGGERDADRVADPVHQQ